MFSNYFQMQFSKLNLILESGDGKNQKNQNGNTCISFKYSKTMLWGKTDITFINFFRSSFVNYSLPDLKIF